MLPSTAAFAAFLSLALAFASSYGDAREALPVGESSRANTEHASTTRERLRDGSRQKRMDAVRPNETPSREASSGRSRGLPQHAAGAVEAPVWDAVQVVVYKSKRLLAVYRGGVFEREFRVVLGLAPEGRKRHANDARTPEGLYHVTGKRRHERWQHFLALDYPNAKDRERYENEVRRGTIPDEDGKPFGIGGDIGIHGNDREGEQASGVDWTKGCIALSATDIEAVAGLVPVGTDVWIVE